MRKSPHPVSQVCPKCGSTDFRLINVRVGSESRGGVSRRVVDPSTYGECGACGKKISKLTYEELQAILQGKPFPTRSWWSRLLGK